MLYSGEQVLSFKPCLLFYSGDSLKSESHTLPKFTQVKYIPLKTEYECRSSPNGLKLASLASEAAKSSKLL